MQKKNVWYSQEQVNINHTTNVHLDYLCTVQITILWQDDRAVMVYHGKASS